MTTAPAATPATWLRIAGAAAVASGGAMGVGYPAWALGVGRRFLAHAGGHG